MSDLDAYLPPHEPDPQALERLTAHDFDNGWSTGRLSVRAGRLLAELWGLHYDELTPSMKADIRQAAMGVLKDLQGDIDAFEHYLALAQKDVDWMRFTRQCQSVYSVKRRFITFIAKLKVKDVKAEQSLTDYILIAADTATTNEDREFYLRAWAKRQ